MCTGSSYPVYGDEKDMKDSTCNGPAGTTPGELAARSLSLCAHMRLPCITGVLEPDQTRRKLRATSNNEMLREVDSSNRTYATGL